MKRLATIALALLAVSSAADSRKPPKGITLPRGCRDRGCVRERVVSGGDAPFSLFTEYLFAGPAMPLVGSSNLVALCRVASGGSSWECVNGQTGAALTVNQGSGTTYGPTIFGVSTMTDVTSAAAPQVVSTLIDPIWKGNHTVVMAGYATTLTNSGFQHWFGFSDGTNSMYARNESGAFNCMWDGPGGWRIANNGTPAVVDGWGVVSCRRSSNNYTARVNGVDSVDATGASISSNITASTAYYMGDRQSAGLPLRGPYAWVAFYGAALSSAQLGAIESSWWGVDSRVASGLASATYCLDPDGGQATCYFAGANMVGPSGIRAVRGNTADNKWAADSLSATGGTDVGTPTITANASAGPFYSLRQQNDCALVADDSAAAFEGKQGANGYVGNGYYTASFYMGAGDSGTVVDKARIAVDVTGGGWSDAGTQHTCDVTGMTLAVVRRSCQTPLFYADAGSPTVKASYLVGNTAATTGSISVCQRQLTAAGWATIPVLTNTARGSSSQILNPVADAWPSTSRGGKYETVFTPVYSAAADSWDGQGDTVYLFDANDSTPEHGVITLFGYNTAGRAMARTESSGSQTEFILDGVTLTPYQLYAVSMEWRPEPGGTCSVKWRWNTCSGSVAACSATTERGSTTGGVCPAQPVEAELANRYDSSIPTDVFISAVRIYSL